MAGLLGAALGVGASIFGGISASKAMRKVKDNLKAQMRENEDWFNRKYNEDATQRADAQRALAALDERVKGRNAEAAATAAVMGSTNEGVAAAKVANAKAMADAVSGIAAAGDAKKDAIESQYLNRKSALNTALNTAEENRAKAMADAVKGAASAAGNMFNGTDALDEYLGLGKAQEGKEGE